jgi:hypothetical protein
MSKDAAVRDEATRPVLNVVEAFRAGVTPRALNMELFAISPIASELYLVVVYFAPMEHGWRRGNAGTRSQLLARPSRDLNFAPLKSAGRPPGIGIYSLKRKVVVVSS